MKYTSNVNDSIEKDASSSEIRKAYRRLSLQLHPDKNKEPDAEHQFRKVQESFSLYPTIF